MSPTSIPPESNDAASPPQYDLFVVHSEADRTWVEGYLKHALGLDPARVLTPREFRLGESIAAEFERGVTSSRFTLLVLSPAFLADRWAEFGEGLVSFSSVDECRNRLLALTLHACQAPLRLRFRESLDCSDRAHWDEETARLRRHLDAPEPAIEDVPCPYPGMVPFRSVDARFFHGRDEEIQTLVGLVRHNHFLVVIGSSGSGKSSLVTAGLRPKLDDPRNFPRGTWRVLTMRPGATPIEELSRTLPGAPTDAPGAIAATLAIEPAAQKLLLVVDQFEELFSQVKDATMRAGFIGQLKALRSDSRCTVIMTIRADFYGDLMNSTLWPINKSEIIEIVPLRGEALRQAITKPAVSVGVYLEDALVERLIADAAEEPGSLPMLQEALVLLWSTMSRRLLTRAAYEGLGRGGRSGLAVAMAMKADATYASLPPDQQRLGRRTFIRLIQFGEGRPDTRRQLGVDDLRAETDDPRAFEEFINQSVANRLLTSSIDEARGQRVDISHEMLIYGWPIARAWVEAHRSAEKTRRRLVAKAEEWGRLGHGEGGLLDAAELVEADGWLKGPDAIDLGIDADVKALVQASRRAIGFQKRRSLLQARIAIGGLTVALLAITSLAAWGELKRRELDIARTAAERNAELAKSNAAEVMIEAGSAALASGHSFDAMHRFAAAIPALPEQSSQRMGTRQGLGFLARVSPHLETILNHSGSARSCAFSPDGSRVVTASDDDTARVWRTESGTLVAELKGHEGRVNSAAFSHDGSRVVTASDDRTARVWRTESGSLLGELTGHAGKVYSAAFSPDGTRIVTASDDKTARVWTADSGKLLKELTGHSGVVASAAFSPDGTHIVTASFDETARVWTADSGKLLKELTGHSGVVASAAFSPDGTHIVTASFDETVRVWMAHSGTLLAELKGHTGKVNSAAFSPDGTRIVTASDDNKARVWMAHSGTLLAELKGHAGEVNSAAFSPDGTRIATASGDNTVRVWRADSSSLLAELKGHAGAVSSAAFSPDGTRIVTASQDNTARVWRADSGSFLTVLKGHAEAVQTAAFSPDGTRIVTASLDKTARVWRADSGELLYELRGHADGVDSAAFSPDGTRIVTASYDKTARVWRADSGQFLRVLRGHTSALTSAAFSPDGSRIFTASSDKTARVWTADSGSVPVELKGHANEVYHAAFSPDNTRIVTASSDKTARVWLADSGSLLAELNGHTGPVISAAFSPDGTRIVTGSWDNTARVWIADSGALLAELKGHADVVSSASFSPDGTCIVTGSWDKTARIWRFDTVSGDVSNLPLWVETLTGTKLTGNLVVPLSLDEWSERKSALQAQRDKAPAVDWFNTPKSMSNSSTAPAK